MLFFHLKKEWQWLLTHTKFTIYNLSIYKLTFYNLHYDPASLSLNTELNSEKGWQLAKSSWQTVKYWERMAAKCSAGLKAPFLTNPTKVAKSYELSNSSFLCIPLYSKIITFILKIALNLVFSGWGKDFLFFSFGEGQPHSFAIFWLGV